MKDISERGSKGYKDHHRSSKSEILPFSTNQQFISGKMSAESTRDSLPN